MMARNGMTPTEIGKILTNEKTLVPSEIVGNSHLRTDDELKRGWNRNTVKRILQNVTYLGWVSNQISYYLEEYFIEKGVRFIAVTDDIDTGHIETSEEMMNFKAFFNEWFLRDTSRKVRNGKKTRAKEGKVMTTYPTYRL